MEKIRPEVTCKFCGAPVRTELCPYCGKPTGLDTSTAVMDYPEVQCKESQLDFWGTIFPLIFALSFGFFGFAFPPLFGDMYGMEIIFIPFKAISIAAGAIVFMNLWRHVSVLLCGKDIEGTVYGYIDDVVTYNDIPGQVCKILVDSRHGKRFIMYQLKSVKKPYKVNSKLQLKVYKDRFMIVDNHKYDMWE